MPDSPPGRRRFVERLVASENLDLYFLAFAALIFTILGVNGISDAKTLSSVLLALLAFLALSQIKSRRQVAQIAKAQRLDPSALFKDRLPPELGERRSSASDLLFIGVSLLRTTQTARNDLHRVLTGGGRVRVMLIDPTNQALLDSTDYTFPINLRGDGLRRRLLTTLADLERLRDETGSSRLEIRVSSIVPKMSFQVFDAGTPRAVMYMTHNEYRPKGDSLPVFKLEPTDGYWYAHFADEASRLWEDGEPWPLSSEQSISRLSRPVFLEQFDAEIDACLMAGAKKVLITGATRNTFFNLRFSKLEHLLVSGCEVRVLLVNPQASSVDVIADRYYAERSPVSVRERVQHSLRVLAELDRIANARLEVRLTDFPISAGIVAIELEAGRPSSLFAEIYTYRARGEPKFVIQSTDRRAYGYFIGEAEALWRSAKPANLT